MTKSEFESLIGENISDGDYEMIETVYRCHPSDFTKQGVANLYFLYGIHFLDYTFEHAVQNSELSIELVQLQNRIDVIRQKLQVIKENALIIKDFTITCETHSI